MENVYTSVGCNRTCHCIARSKEGLVYYGACSAIAVYSPARRRVLHTLVQHTSRVNCLSLAEAADASSYLCAGCSGGQLSIWRIQNGEHPLLTSLEAHTGSVTCLSAVVFNGSLVLASTGNDSTLKVWRLDLAAGDAKPVNLTNLDLKTGLVFSLHLVPWPQEFLTLLYAGDDCRINIALVDSQHEGSELRILERLKGHDDWITALDTVQVEGSMLLASASQDSTIRLWRLEPRLEERTSDLLEVKEVLLEYPGGTCHSVQLESVLSGHEDKVFSVSWNLGSSGLLRLLSVSLDKTMIVWQEEEGVWMENARVGEIGGNTLGMLGAAWGQDGDILGYSFSGAFHAWRPSEAGWTPGLVIGGHQGPVADITWDVSGAYLLSVGTDQTTRCHAQCVSTGGTWHEVARPQVHGYDMSCIATLPNFTFVSGAEEKVLRAFQAPQNFLDNFMRLTGRTVPSLCRGNLPQGASLPTLGLSNKAVFEGEKIIPEEERHVKDQFPDSYFSPEVLDAPPTEESLVQNTLWPELHKMYGHGYELYSVCSSRDGRLVASACKSSQPSEAAIIIWDTTTWKQIGRIEAHSLTVTQLQFSPVSSVLLSVSRDRSWALHSLAMEDAGLRVQRLAYSDKKSSPHKRIIWTCCWTFDGNYFFTGSRDKLVICWSSAEGWDRVGEPLLLPDSVNALASPQSHTTPYRLAAGLDNGHIHLYSWNSEFQLLHVLNSNAAHHLTVTRLSFSPTDPNMLASCSMDQAVKIYTIDPASFSSSASISSSASS